MVLMAPPTLLAPAPQPTPPFPLRQLMAGLPYFGVKLARGHCPEGQALQALELRGAKNSPGVHDQSRLRSGLRPGLLGVLNFS